MPLITSNTDLKSLSFGHDRPGGGSSGQPFLFTGFNIPEVDFSSNQTLTDAYSASAGAGAGQNFFDIPPFTFDAPTFGYAPGNSTVKTTLFNGNGIDIATPILNGLDGIAGGIVNGAEAATNAIIGTINNSFDTTRNPSSPDFLWRKNRYNIAHSVTDAVRITKFLTTPAGIFFIIKQELLERQSVKVEGTTRVYNPASTIAQAGVNSIGYHLNKSGLNPFERSYAEGGRNGYYWNTKNSIGQLGVRNELTIEGKGPNRLTTLMLNKINRVATGFDQFGITGVENRDILLRYNGGPGAPLGIGFTRISLTDPTRQVPLVENKTNFIYDNVNIDNPNYLIPLFKEGRYKVYWLYNPFDATNDTGTRSVFQQFKLRNPDNKDVYTSYFGTQDNTFAILNRNTKVISSSLYSHPGALVSGTKISKKGDDPSKPEYYTPTGQQFSVNWVYNAIKPNENLSPEDAKIISEALQNRSSISTGKNTNKNLESNDEFALDNTQIAGRKSLGQEKNTGFGSSGVYDFRSSITPQLPSTNYTLFNRDKTYQSSQTSYKGNFVPGYGRVLNPNLPISGEAEKEERASDIIDFNFTLHVPGTSPNRLIDFTAYIEDWSDGVKAEWNPIKYMGRAESFYKYGGFSREASVTFLVPALSRRNLIANYKKLNALAWAVSPSYSDIGLMRGVITYFTMGDYFRQMPSIIKNVEFSQIDDMGWDINRSLTGDILLRSDSNYTGQLPKGIKVTVGFTPLHHFTPQVGSEYIGYDPETVSSYPSIYTPNPKGGQSPITSDSSLGRNDRVPILSKENAPPPSLPPPPPPPPPPIFQTQQTILNPGDLNDDFSFGKTQGPSVIANIVESAPYEDEERRMYTQETEATVVQAKNDMEAAAYEASREDLNTLGNPVDAIPNAYNTASPYGPTQGPISTNGSLIDSTVNPTGFNFG